MKILSIDERVCKTDYSHELHTVVQFYVPTLRIPVTLEDGERFEGWLPYTIASAYASSTLVGHVTRPTTSNLYCKTIISYMGWSGVPLSRAEKFHSPFFSNFLMGLRACTPGSTINILAKPLSEMETLRAQLHDPRRVVNEAWTAWIGGWPNVDGEWLYSDVTLSLLLDKMTSSDISNDERIAVRGCALAERKAYLRNLYRTWSKLSRDKVLELMNRPGLTHRESKTVSSLREQARAYAGIYE